MVVCKSCGAELIEGAAFCMKCGSKVTADDIPATNDSVPEEIMPLIINVNDDEYEVTFWVKDESKVKENKYEDFIAIIKKPYNDLYFIAEPFSEHNTLFYGVYVDWDEDNEVPDDEDFDNKCVQYLLEYHNRGKQVSINEIYFESQNGKTTEEELTDVIALCCMDGVEEEDHANGCELFKFDEDYFDDAHLEYLKNLYQQEDLLEDKSEEQSDSAAPVQPVAPVAPATDTTEDSKVPEKPTEPEADAAKDEPAVTPDTPPLSLQKGQSVKYNNIIIYRDFHDTLKAKCAFCKKDLSIPNLNLMYVANLKPKFGSSKTFNFCSMDCAKKWIDAEGSKYKDNVVATQEALKKSR